MIVEVAKLDAMQYSVQYELLRSQVIGLAGNAAQGDTAANQRRGVGLALFLSKGMPEWIETVETVLRATLTPRAVDAPDPAPREGSLPSSATAVCCLASVRHECPAPRLFVGTVHVQRRIISLELARELRRDLTRQWLDAVYG